MTYLLCLSGGFDSRLLLWEYGDDIPLAVFYDYGQPQKQMEWESAKRAWREAGREFHPVYIELPLGSKTDQIVWDCRNATFAAYGAMLAAQHKIDAVMLGCNFSDRKDFPDCRPEFWGLMRNAYAAAGYSVHISTPLLETSKAEIMEKCRKFNLDGWTCYNPTPTGDQCGKCYACKAAGIAS